MRRRIKFLTLALLATVIAGRCADAGVTYSFNAITSNNSINTAIGESQLRLTVSDAGGGFVNFEFSNSGAEKLSITKIYFDDVDDNAMFASSIVSIDDSQSGVSFSEYTGGGNLSGGAAAGFQATAGLAAFADKPRRTRNGVNPGESVGILLDVANGHSFGDITTALADNSLKIGLQSQGFALGGKESFVADGSPPAVPEPASLAIFN